MKLYTLLLTAIALQYPRDQVKAGLVLAEIDTFCTWRRYHASIVRWPNGIDRPREVVCTANGKTLPATLKLLIKAWLPAHAEIVNLLEHASL
jgi:hypothetical protein